MKKNSNHFRRLVNYNDRLRAMTIAPDMGAVYPIARGDVFSVKRKTAIAQEINRECLCVVVGSDFSNAFGSTVRVVYLSGQIEGLNRSDTVGIHFQGNPRAALCGQSFPVDRARLKRYVGRVSPKELSAIDDRLRARGQLPFEPGPQSERQAG